MRNVLVIDGATNCAYDIYAMPVDLFAKVFPEDGQDVEIIEDYSTRRSDDEDSALWTRMWASPVLKRDVCGIRAMLFYELDEKRDHYPNKRDSDLDFTGRPFATV